MSGAAWQQQTKEKDDDFTQQTTPGSGVPWTWQHQSRGVEARHEGRVFYTYGPERGYKDKNGTWKSTSSFSPEEWEVVNGLLERARSYVETAMANDARQAEEAEASA